MSVDFHNAGTMELLGPQGLNESRVAIEVCQAELSDHEFT